MVYDPLLISLPVADRVRAHAFYREGLGLDAIGEPADDGVKAIVERARRAGATVATEPAPQPWGYAASFADPDGHIWMVTSAKLPD